MKKVELNINGMHCTGCSARLEKILNNTEGVMHANVSFETKIASIEFNEDIVSLNEIKETIKDAGFEIKGE